METAEEMYAQTVVHVQDDSAGHVLV